MKSLLVIFSISFLLFTSCNSSTGPEATNKNSGEETDIVESGSISFSKDVQPLFDHDCVSCHEYLESNVSYKMLTTNNSSSVGSSQYINIENPTESYLYIKLKEEPPCGSTMGGEWTDEEKNLVLKWIEEGAKNN